MLIKTVVDATSENTKGYKGYCRAEGMEDFQDIELQLAEVEYDDSALKALSREIAEYYIHTVFISDYESSSDAGDGRDDYYTEEKDEEIALTSCIVKNGLLFGVMCESFERQGFLLLDYPETIIYHPGNYGGRNYHYYRKKQFKLVRKK